MNNLALVESKSLREEHIEQVEVLDKIKAIEYMTEDMIVSVEQAADYYEVGKKAINAIINRNNGEFINDGVKVLEGKELKLFKGNLQVADSLKYASHFTIIPRRALLRIGMLLTESGIAKKVRDYLLNSEQNHNKSEIDDNTLKLAIKSFREIKKVLDEVGATAEAKLETTKSIFSKAGIDIPVTVDDLKKNTINTYDPSRKLWINSDLMNQIREIENTTFAAMAKKIGISRVHFNEMRQWKRPVGEVCQSKLNKTYPEYLDSLYIERD